MTPLEKIDHYVLQLHKMDVGHVCRTLLGLEVNPLSPFASILREYHTGTAPRTRDIAVLKEVADTPDAAQALAILTNPEVRLSLCIGGGLVGLSNIFVCRNRRIDAKAVVMATLSSDDSFFIQSFPSTEGFVLWNLDIMSSVIDEQPSSMLPELMSLESFVYTLHAMDSFRRVAYESMLEAKVLEEPFISVDRFRSSMALTMKSGDLRWLLPCFFRLMPGFKSLDLSPQMAGLQFLISNDVLKTLQHADTHEDVLIFGEKGRCLAIDFYRTWWACAGLELIGWDGTSARRLHRSFMAATAVANHFFEAKSTKDEAMGVKYSALTTNGLGLKLGAVLDITLPESKIKTDADVQKLGPKSGAMATPVSAICSKCGFPVAENSAFCTKCGTTLKPSAITIDEEAPPPTAPKTCPSCQRSLTPDAIFCPGCGVHIGNIAQPPAQYLQLQSKMCLTCNKALKPNAKFCGHCGAPAS